MVGCSPGNEAPKIRALPLVAPKKMHRFGAESNVRILDEELGQDNRVDGMD